MYLKVTLSNPNYVTQELFATDFSISGPVKLAKAPSLPKSIKLGVSFSAKLPVFAKSSTKPDSTTVNLIGCSTLAQAKKAITNIVTAGCTLPATNMLGGSGVANFKLPKTSKSIKFVLVQVASGFGRNYFNSYSNIAKVK